jgi:hypothetical protein
VWNELAVEAITILLWAATALVVLFLSGLSKYLQEQARRVENDAARGLIQSALSEAEKVGIDAVQATNQVFVDAIKASSADGKLSKEDAATAMRIAVEYFKTHLSSRSYQVLSEPDGKLDDKWISDFLEARLAQTKAESSRCAYPLPAPLPDCPE